MGKKYTYVASIHTITFTPFCIKMGGDGKPVGAVMLT